MLNLLLANVLPLMAEGRTLVRVEAVANIVFLKRCSLFSELNGYKTYFMNMITS